MVFHYTLLIMFYTDGGDDQNPIVQNPEDKGGAAAGTYGPEDPNIPIPGETEGIDNSQLG